MAGAARQMLAAGPEVAEQRSGDPAGVAVERDARLGRAQHRRGDRAADRRLQEHPVVRIDLAEELGADGQRRVPARALGAEPQLEVGDPAAVDGARDGRRRGARTAGVEGEARGDVGLDRVEPPPRLAPGDPPVEVLVEPGHDLDVAERQPQVRLDVASSRSIAT